MGTAVFFCTGLVAFFSQQITIHPMNNEQPFDSDKTNPNIRIPEGAEAAGSAERERDEEKTQEVEEMMEQTVNRLLAEISEKKLERERIAVARMELLKEGRKVSYHGLELGLVGTKTQEVTILELRNDETGVITSIPLDQLADDGWELADGEQQSQE